MLDDNEVRERYRRLHLIVEPELTKEERKLMQLVLEHNAEMHAFLSCAFIFMAISYWALHNGRDFWDFVTFVSIAGAQLLGAFYEKRRYIKKIQRILNTDLPSRQHE